MLRRHVTAACCGLALAAALAGCGGDGAREADAARETGAAGATTTEARRLEVEGIRLGNALAEDRTIRSETDDFRPTETIYAVVSTRGSAPQATLRAVWRFEDGQIVDEQTQTITPTGPAHTEFHISKPSGWPAGEYRVEFFLDGQSVGTKEFEVEGR